MGRNRDVERLHRLTGWPYKECRAKIKADPDYLQSAELARITDWMTETLPKIVDGICEVMHTLAEEIKNLVDAFIGREEDPDIIPCVDCRHFIQTTEFNVCTKGVPEDLRAENGLFGCSQGHRREIDTSKEKV